MHPFYILIFSAAVLGYFALLLSPLQCFCIGSIVNPPILIPVRNDNRNLLFRFLKMIFHSSDTGMSPYILFQFHHLFLLVSSGSASQSLKLQYRKLHTFLPRYTEFFLHIPVFHFSEFLLLFDCPIVLTLL